MHPAQGIIRVEEGDGRLQPMQEITARCGNRCDLCPLYEKNFSPDEAEVINDRLYKYHHAGEGPHPRYTRGCDGCLSGGYVAREGCKIRECVTTKGLTTCAECEELFCELLEADMTIVEGALSHHNGEMSQEDYERYFRPFLIRERLTTLRAHHGKVSRPCL